MSKTFAMMACSIERQDIARNRQRRRDTHADHAETDRDEGQTRDSGRPAASVLEDEWEGAEETVQHTVDDGRV